MAESHSASPPPDDGDPYDESDHASDDDFEDDSEEEDSDDYDDDYDAVDEEDGDDEDESDDDDDIDLDLDLDAPDETGGERERHPPKRPRRAKRTLPGFGIRGEKPAKVVAPRVDRPPRPKEPVNPAVWLSAGRMSQTECALRVGMWLIASGHAAGDVEIALRGRELTRRDAPRFPVSAFLTAYRFLAREPSDDWMGAYAAEGVAHGLVLSARRTGADVRVRISDIQQMHIAVASGRLTASRSSTEFKVLWGTIGRAVCWEGVGESDFLAAVVPRSEQYRKAAGAMRRATRVRWAGLSVMTVDRAGNVDGSPV